MVVGKEFDEGFIVEKLKEISKKMKVEKELPFTLLLTLLFL